MEKQSSPYKGKPDLPPKVPLMLRQDSVISISHIRFFPKIFTHVKSGENKYQVQPKREDKTTTIRELTMRASVNTTYFS